MKKGFTVLGVLALVVCFTSMAGCDEAKPAAAGFNLEFRYGVMARNILDTFEGTYTKDMVSDPSITVELSLSEEDKDNIFQKMVEIDFFNYPDDFSVDVSSAEGIGMATPYYSYYFRVEYDSQVKELQWDDEITNPDEKAEQLRELIRLIKDIIEAKEEYQELPKPTSGYQ